MSLTLIIAAIFTPISALFGKNTLSIFLSVAILNAGTWVGKGRWPIKIGYIDYVNCQRYDIIFDIK